MSSRNQFILIGAIVGAILGSAAAYAYLQSQRTGGLFATKKVNGREVQVKAGAGDYFRIATAVFALVRQIQGMVRPS